MKQLCQIKRRLSLHGIETSECEFGFKTDITCLHCEYSNGYKELKEMGRRRALLKKQVLQRLAQLKPTGLDIFATLNKLERMGYLNAPASTKYHGAHPGGLAEHSIAVCDELVKLTKKLELKWENPRSPYIIGLFHDLCKCDQYKRIKNGYEYRENNLLSGHGEKSVMLLSQIMRLTDEEVFCIRYHMGAYERDDWTGYDLAIKKYPTVLYTHTADMLASKLQV